jgi:hypothetical protein
MVAKVKETVNNGVRYITRQIASIIGILLEEPHTILKRDLKMRIYLLKQYQNCKTQYFANIVTITETRNKFNDQNENTKQHLGLGKDHALQKGPSVQKRKTKQFSSQHRIPSSRLFT